MCRKDQLVVLFDIFAPDMCLLSICTMLVIAAAQDYCICQIDVEGTYLNETLTTDEATPIRPSIPNAFGKIFVGDPHKTFYGLKQPERWWYQRLVGVMMGDIRFWRDDEGIMIKAREKLHT